MVIDKRFRFEVAPEDEQGKYNWFDAQKACSMRGNGWRLPTREEQLLMRGHKKELGLKDGHYWSSSEYYSNDAWYQDFYNGNQYSSYKYDRNRVRAVRTVESK